MSNTTEKENDMTSNRYPAAADSLQSILASLTQLQNMGDLSDIAQELAELDDTLGTLVDDTVEMRSQ